jgi:hypothetical protein
VLFPGKSVSLTCDDVFVCTRYLNRHADVNSSCFDVPKIYGKFPGRAHNVLCLLIAKQKRQLIDQKHIRPLCKNKSRRVSCLRRESNLCLFIPAAAAQRKQKNRCFSKGLLISRRNQYIKMQRAHAAQKTSRSCCMCVNVNRRAKLNGRIC